MDKWALFYRIKEGYRVREGEKFSDWKRVISFGETYEDAQSQLIKVALGEGYLIEIREEE